MTHLRRIKQELGKLMNESHYSCRDFFDCSCNELNDITSLCRYHHHPLHPFPIHSHTHIHPCRDAGAVGSRLTGAGWGGWTISMVPSELLESFMVKVSPFYAKALEADSSKTIEDYLLATKAGSGAAVYVPS